MSTVKPSETPQLGATGEYLRLLLVWLATIPCNGVSPGMNLFIPLFAENGIFADICSQPPCKLQLLLISNLLISSLTVSALGILPQGMIFDMVGGRGTAVLGAILVFVGAFIVAFAIELSSVAILTLAAVMMDIGALFSSAAFAGLTWHLPSAQGLLFAVALCSNPASAPLPLIIRACSLSFGFSLSTCFLCYAAVTAASSVILFIAVPTQKEFVERAEAVLGIPVLAENHTWKGFKSSIRMAFRVVVMQKRDVCLFVMAAGLVTAATVPWAKQLWPFEDMVFGDRSIGDEFAVGFSWATPVIGIVGSLVAGIFIDCAQTLIIPDIAGIVIGILVSVSLLSLVLLGSLSSFSDQAICAVLNILISQWAGLVALRWIASWAPPHRFGMVWALVQVAAIIVGFFMMAIWSLIYSMLDGIAAFFLSLCLFGFLSAVSWGILAYRWSTNHKFKMVMIGRDEEELMLQFFGLKSFQEAEDVLQVDRLEILRLLSSHRFEDRRRLLDLMKDPAAQVRWLNLAYAKGYPLPEMHEVDYFILVCNRLFCCT